MKVSRIVAFAGLSTLGLAADQEEVDFLTAFVSDYEDHKKQYVDYFLSATGIPSGLTQLAKEVATYTDDSYTTLLDDDDINITSLMSFATNLPWYSRIESELDDDDSTDTGSVVASVTTSSGSVGSSSIANSTETTSSNIDSSPLSTTSVNACISLLAPGTALLGALGLLML